MNSSAVNGDGLGPASRSGWFTWAIGPGFLLVAAWIMLGEPKGDPPVGSAAVVPLESIAPGERRAALHDPAWVVIGGFGHSCNNCHRLFEAPPVERRRLTQHTHINLNHGMNDRCFNCHDRSNRERLVLHDGTRIGFNYAPRLCAQCHGTVFRDWERGTHGKTMGSWDADDPRRHRLACNDCHDPHSPAYPKFAPLPGPNTLRMGEQHGVTGHSERHIPLQRWSRPGVHETTPPPPTPEEHP